MSEIADAVQILKVTFDGVEIAMKVGSGTIGSMQKALKLIVKLLEHEKLMGKTDLKKLLAKGGDIQIFSFSEKHFRKFQKQAKKYGILYSAMPKTESGMVEVMFHSEAAPRMRMLATKLGEGEIYNFDEYLKEGNKEKLNALLEKLDKEKRGNAGTPVHHVIDGLMQKVGQYAMEKQTVSVEDVKEDFQIEADDAKEIIGKLEKIGVLDHDEKNGVYRAAMDREAFEKRISRYQELAGRMRKMAADRDTNLLDITISKKLIQTENEHAVKTRVPGMYGNRAGYLWLNKEDLMEIHNGKTLLAYLDKNKDYKIYSEDNRVLFTVKGQELLDKHYDTIEKTVRERYQKMQKQAEKTMEWAARQTMRRR